MKLSIYVTIIWALLSIIFASISIVDVQNFEKNSILSEGKIIDFYFNPEDKTTYIYKVEYRINNKTDTFTNNVFTQSRLYVLNQKVKVRYNSERVVVDTFPEKYGLSIVLGIMSFILVAILIILLRVQKKDPLDLVCNEVG